MITKFKIFETSKSLFGISENDYIKIKRSDEFSESYNDFLETHIGKITNISINNFDVNDSYIYVKFEINKNSIYSYNDFIHSFKISAIEFYAKTKNELLLKINSKKYNI